MDESRTVRETYDRIAAHFASTREHPWPEVETFLEGREGSLGLDIGCANGRHAQLLAACTDRVLGVDVSRGLLREARDRANSRRFAVDLVQGDAATLPIRPGRVDIAVYVATIHHLRDRETRVRSLDELARVLGPDGRALVSAWSTAHDRFDSEEGFDTTIEWTLPGGETLPRFYHIYAPEEFRAEVADSALALEAFEVSSGNCYATVRREQ
ncbi:ubiquinone/menaquinone biosynthesis C-methyltransferase UbiE [Halalkalicoccus paucihalophilus]|uniref:Ubiquinone/menaquinone biosynthesis C-methyltransferase UbiE n=1 Tax=Halalkalicoccus paucihalophilus TaxID=1008153 RepID=A0A151ADG0_9EURY|nr:class I SAM-dependent methyltransferase [Halalkalicoccus paucihalophilus]KYH25695.1 ubiquinone/menaquinone biosynthesis C-methyltransferase UbiE [Halalkalicoccus paucihalophilus]